MNAPLHDEIALVTGASRGIGAAIADTLAARGARVIGTATTQTGADAIARRLASVGGHGCVLDVANPASIEQCMTHVSKTWGDVAILVNNAGITRDSLLMRMKDEDWHAVISTNLTGVYHLCKAVVRPMLKARKGRIIHIGSVIASTGNVGQMNYAAAKAGLIGLSKSLAKELGSRGITVNVVSPGFIETDMTRDLPDDLRHTLQQSIALGRFGQPADVAAAVAFLAGPDAGFITGETLHVNGGMYMS